MKVLVAGGAGFIGSHLCERLLTEGHGVLCVDNLVTGHERNIAHLLARPDFHFELHDITVPLAATVDAIFHLASPASPVGYMAHSIETLVTNSQGTHQLLELAKKNGARFLLASTSEVYGDPLVHPQREDYWGNVNPVGPRSCYDESKRFAEALTMEYTRQYRVDVRIVRIFNTYGPRNDPDDGRVMPNFITQALAGQPITIYGDGEQTRSFCYVSDLVEGLLRVMWKDGLTGEIFNLGNPEELTVRQLADLVLELCKSDSIVEHRPLPQDDPTRRKPDIGKARRMLGWEPRVKVAEGLRSSIAWFQEQKGQ